MKAIILSISFLLTTQALASFQCAGGKEACERQKEIYRLEQITGKSCAGGYQACLDYLQDEYDKMKMEADIRAEKQRLNPSEQCWHFFKDHEGEIHAINVCEG
jgi:hypothetical protein